MNAGALFFVVAGAVGLYFSVRSGQKAYPFPSDLHLSDAWEQLSWTGGFSLGMVVLGLPGLLPHPDRAGVLMTWGLSLALVIGVRLRSAYLRYQVVRELNLRSRIHPDAHPVQWVRSPTHVAVLWAMVILTAGAASAFAADWGMGALSKNWNPLRTATYYDTTSGVVVQVIGAMAALAVAAAAVHMVVQAVRRARYGRLRLL